MRNWKLLGQGGNDDIPKDVFTPKVLNKPVVEELLDRSVTASRPFLFVCSDVRMKKRDPIVQDTGNVVHEPSVACQLARAPTR